MKNKYNISLVKVTSNDIEKSNVIFKENELIQCTDDNTYRWGNGKDLMKDLPVWSNSTDSSFIPKPPTDGIYILVSVDGVVSWSSN